MRKRILFGLLVTALFVATFWAQEAEKKSTEAPPADATVAAPAPPPGPHVFTVSAEESARKNPAKFTDVTAGRGKKIYNTQCAMCHGQKGDGKGDIVEEMKINPPDFTKPETLEKRTDGDLFAIIGAGSPVMPGQGKRMVDSQKWNIVNYLRVLAGKAPQRSKGDEPEENVLIIREEPK